jgi:ABC-type molybdate transport system substrate-binding protein
LIVRRAAFSRPTNNSRGWNKASEAEEEAVIRLIFTGSNRNFTSKPSAAVATATKRRCLAAVAVLGIVLLGAVLPFQRPVLAQAQPSKPLAVIPPDKDTDLKLYRPDGDIRKGAEALEQMTAGADLVLWVAGNQFFAMDEVIGVFQKTHPGVTVGLITLPPGLLLSAILGGGWIYNGKEYRGTPDVYASVNLGHLKQLKAAGFMRVYETYMHNELQMMVAKGNPKRISAIDDLVRSDVRTSLPNPVNEGIMQFYARKVLERHGLWLKISSGQECVSCQTTERNWFTAVHHRETPERIRDNKSDAGIVWKTEVMEALRQGAEVDAVELPVADSLRDEVSYAVGPLENAKHRENAEAFLAFLGTAAAQDAYAKFGFVKARPDELMLKPID